MAKNSPADNKGTLFELFGPLVDVYEKVQDRYVSEVDPKKLRDGAIEGMLDKLDPYSNYISAEDRADFEKNLKGEFGGIGIQIGLNDRKMLTVISPLEDTPAFRAGIMAGDWIKEIDGKSTYEPRPMTLNEAVSKLTGKPGTKVNITIVHETDKDAAGRKIELTRAVIKLHSIKGWKRSVDGDGSKWDFMMDPKSKLGYIRVTSFVESTDAELDAAVQQLMKDGMKGLILDLRFNPGGLLESAVKIADRFLKKGTIVSMKGRRSPEKTYTAKEAGTYPDFELVVLINEGSASASEILSGALKDHGRATIVGVRSFGKGSVQNIMTLDDGGKALLKLTTAYYYLPNGKCVHKLENATEWGVDPDKEVKVTPQEIAGLFKARRDSEVIRPGHAPGQPAAQPGEEKKPEAKPEEKKPEGKSDAKPEDGAKSDDKDKDGKDAKDKKKDEPFVDRQLEEARNILLGQVLSAERKAAANK
jgi:carboxyl-terminal processing protease